MLDDVEDMANVLRKSRDAPRVGTHWADGFVRRHPELKPRYRALYDYVRDGYPDLRERIGGWFRAFSDTVAKYGIRDADIYSFSETGFTIGEVSTAGQRARAEASRTGNQELISVVQAISAAGWAVPPFIVLEGRYHPATTRYQENRARKDWAVATSPDAWTTREVAMGFIRHFDKHTSGRVSGAHRLLVTDFHESRQSIEFHDFCKTNNIVTLCMPLDTSHLLQPLDAAALFDSLRLAYRQVTKPSRPPPSASLVNILREQFFSALEDKFPQSFTKEKIQAGFRAAGLVPYKPTEVISRLPVSETARGPTEHQPQSNPAQHQASRHQTTPPSPILPDMDQITKSMKTIADKYACLEAEVKLLRVENQELRRARKNHVREGGDWRGGQTVQDRLGQPRQAHVVGDGQARLFNLARYRTARRSCGRCGGTDHATKACLITISSSEESD